MAGAIRELTGTTKQFEKLLTPSEGNPGRFSGYSMRAQQDAVGSHLTVPPHPFCDRRTMEPSTFQFRHTNGMGTGLQGESVVSRRTV